MSDLFLPLGLGSALLMAQLSIHFQPELSSSSPCHLPLLLLQIASRTFPLRICQNVALLDGQIAGSLLHNGQELLIHFDCLNEEAKKPENICQFLLADSQTAGAFLLWPKEEEAVGHGPECIQNVTLNGQLLPSSFHWCRPANRPRRNVPLLERPKGQRRWRQLDLAEKLKASPGRTVPVEWFHLWLIGPSRVERELGEEVQFEVVDRPENGQIVMEEGNSHLQPVSRFSYRDVLAKRILYKNFGTSGWREDSFKLKVESRRVARKAVRRLAGSSWRGNLPSPSADETLTVDVDVQQQPNEENPPPQLAFGSNGPTVHVKPGTRIQLGQEHLRVYHPHISPDRIWLHLEEISPSLDLLDRTGMRLRRFSLGQFLGGEVHLLAADEAQLGANEEGQIALIARDDKGGQSSPLTLRVTFSPLKVVLDRNAGIRLAQHSSQLIEPDQLHAKCTNPATNAELRSIPARYSIVDQPQFGVVECLARGEGHPEEEASRWTICSQFFQSDIDSMAVRYRHTNANRSRGDDFDFQVHCVDSSSPVQTLQIDFITISLRVFVQEALTLNQTDQAVLGRKNMLATVFPQNFQADQLVFHLVEAPKLGMLLRLVPETGKQRRVGISSNFTQQQVDESLLSYKLHFAPFSVLNDFFSFRLLTPAGPSDELFRFDIVYLPGGGAGEIRLLNRTLVVQEGGVQQVSNATLWLESADGKHNFAFKIGLPPLNGRLLLEGEGKRKKPLDFDDIFHSEDILANRLFYEHSGEESHWDRIFLLAESETRDPGGGKGHTPLPFFLSISVLNENNRAPQLLQSQFGAKVGEQNSIHLLDNGERTLWPSLLPLVDLDGLEMWPSTLEQSRFFPVAKSQHPLSFHVLPEPANSRDFVICAREAPELPLREFGEEQLRSGQLILRHLGGARNVTMLKLSVTDGRHSVPVPIWMFASTQPFLRLATSSQLQFRPLALDGTGNALILLTIAELWAQTNVDVPDSAILFQFHSLLPESPFHLLHPNGTFRESWQFSQNDILANRLFFSADQIVQAIFLKLQIEPSFGLAQMPKPEELVLNLTFLGNSTTETRPTVAIYVNEDGLAVPRGGSSPLDGNLMGLPIGEELFAKFYIVKAPKHGEILFQRAHKSKEVAPSANYNIPLLAFDQAILLSGSMQFLHRKELANGQDWVEEEDEFALKVLVQSKKQKDFLVQIGPLSVPVYILPQNQLQLMPATSQPIQLSQHSELALDEHLTRFSLPNHQISLVQFRIIEISPSLALHSRRSGQTIRSGFSHAEYTSGDVLVKPKSGIISNQKAKIVLQACNAKCSRPIKLAILLAGKGKEGLERNEEEQPIGVLPQGRGGGDSVRLRAIRQLENSNKFLTWQPRGGYLYRTSLPSEPISEFTQNELEGGEIWFKFEPANGEGKGSFFFLFGDGLTQRGPELFKFMRGEAEKRKGTNETISRVGLTQNEFGSLVRLVRKEKLLAAPGVQMLIGSELLNASGRIHPDKIVYQITKPPMHGRILLVGTQGRILHFTQSDINANRLFYQSQANIGTWAQLDQFHFKLAISDAANADQHGEEIAFDIENSFSNLALADLPNVLPINTVRCSKGGSVALNISHLDLTKLAEYTDDDIFIKLHRQPAQGWIERVDEMAGFADSKEAEENYVKILRRKGRRMEEEYSNEEMEEDNSRWNTPLSAEQFHSGAFLVYRHLRNLSTNSAEQQADSWDHFQLVVYGKREPSKGLKLSMGIQLADGPASLMMEHLAREVPIVSGGTVRLAPNFLLAHHPSLGPSKISYQLAQQPKNGVRLILASSNEESPTRNATPVAKFTQMQINQGVVQLEHIALDERSRKWDLIGLRVQPEDRKGQFGHTFVLIVRIESLALHLHNFTEISYLQGKTYILLDRSHLGAESNGDRSQIAYNITKRPQNGTFYWVDGEKEADSFTQEDIDRNEILYAQMNMNAFEDSFEFILSDDEMELLPKTGRIRVLPVFQPGPLSASSRTITQLGLSHLNATALEGTSPRYLLVNEPKYCRLFIHPRSNESAVFFTHDDVLNGRLFFHAFDVPRRVKEKIVLELRSDNVQPARITWSIEIRPNEEMAANGEAEETNSADDEATDGSSFRRQAEEEEEAKRKVLIAPPPPDMNYHFPIAILIAVVLLVVGILLCRKRNPEEQSVSEEDEGGQKKSSTSEKGTSSLRNSTRNKSGSDGTRNAMFILPSAAKSMEFNGRGGLDTTKNLLDATVYATINCRQPKGQASNFCAETEERRGIFGRNASDDIDDSPPFHVDKFNTAPVKKDSTISARMALPITRSDSKEHQQLLASAISAAFALNNTGRRESEAQENEINILQRKDSAVKNEFWV